MFSFSLLKQEYQKIKNYDNYDYIIDLQGLIKSGLIARIIGKNTYGFDENSLRESFASWFYKSSYEISYSENVIKRYAGLISHIFNIPMDDESLENKERILGYKDQGVFEKYETKYMKKKKQKMSEAKSG